MMYGQGADFGHKCMRWLLGLTGNLPKRAWRSAAPLIAAIYLKRSARGGGSTSSPVQ